MTLPNSRTSHRVLTRGIPMTAAMRLIIASHVRATSGSSRLLRGTSVCQFGMINSVSCR